MKFLLHLSAALFVVLGLGACNTVRGFGEDISSLGRALSNSTGTTGDAH